MDPRPSPRPQLITTGIGGSAALFNATSKTGALQVEAEFSRDFLSGETALLRVAAKGFPRKRSRTKSTRGRSVRLILNHAAADYGPLRELRSTRCAATEGEMG